MSFGPLSRQRKNDGKQTVQRRMKYLGIDLGSSFIKTVFMDADAKSIVDRRSDEMPGKTECAVRGAYEIDAAQIVRKVTDVIEEYAAGYPEEIEGLLLSVQMHGFVYSVPHRRDMYVSWQDMRCLNQRKGDRRTYLEYLEELIPKCDMTENGVYLKPAMGMCNLYAMLEDDPSIPRNGTLYTLGSYIIYSLTGKNVTHAESFAPLGFLDVHHRCIHEKIIQKMDFGRIAFPEIVWKDCEVCGIYRTGNCKIKVFPDYGDMQVAVLGSDVHEGDMVINTATASQVAYVSSEFVPGGYEIRPYFGDRFLYTISNMPAGRNLAVLVDFMKEIVFEMTEIKISTAEVWEKVHSLAGQQDENLQVDVNFYKNPYFVKGGSIQHIFQDNLHIGTLFSAAYQNMAETYWKYAAILTESVGEINGIVCPGGVNWRTPELVRKIQKISGKQCRLSTMKDEAAAGLLCLAVECSKKQMKRIVKGAYEI